MKANNLQEHSRREYTAEQNLERIFSYYPVVNTMSTRVNLDKICAFEEPCEDPAI